MVTVKRQQGLALITVLLVFAVVSLLATTIIDRQATDVQRSANMLTMQQSRALVFSAERLARNVLYLDWDSDKEKDHAKERWTTPINSKPADVDWKIYAALRDAQGRFNLNSLLPESANKTLQLQRFRNLLKLLDLDVQLASSVSRWMDKTSQVDDIYEALEPPYRAAYQGCKHVSELLLIDQLDMKTYQALLPYISCLPMEVQLNVNTASAIVLASLDSGLTLGDGEQLVNARGDKGFSSVDDFWNQDLLKSYTQPQNNGNNSSGNQNNQPKWQKGDFSIVTEYFELFARIDLNERYATTEVLINRDKNDGRMVAIYRDYSRREEKPRELLPGQQNSNKNSTNNSGSQFSTGS